MEPNKQIVTFWHTDNILRSSMSRSQRMLLEGENSATGVTPWCASRVDFGLEIAFPNAILDAQIYFSEAGTTTQMANILLFPVNGSGMGHMNRCLAYARRMCNKAECSFFSLASAIEYIEAMGFAVDYFVSPFWSCNSTYDWNTELAIRFGMMLERTRPEVVVFDGTWPFQGFLAACRAYGRPLKLVWSNRGLLKKGAKEVPVDESLFDLIIVPGELGAASSELALGGGRKIGVPPVTLLDDSELFAWGEARRRLGLEPLERYALVSLGPGNLKDITGIGHHIIQELQARGYRVVWACAPIAVHDLQLPPTVTPISVYPLVRYLKAFDIFVGAGGYNTCCEVVQAQTPSLLIPNTLLADDQARRAQLVARHAPIVVSPCETHEETVAAVCSLLQLAETSQPATCSLPLDGAARAAEAIVALAQS